MEYSVYDLIRVLLKKWYIIVLTMLLLGGAAAFLSQSSYKAALDSYERYTSQTVPVNTEIGSYSAAYQCGFNVTDFSRYQEQYAQKNSFVSGYLAALGLDISTEQKYLEAENSFTMAKSDFLSLFSGASVTAQLQAFAAEQGYLEPVADVSDTSGSALVVSDHMTAVADESGLVTISIMGLSEEVARALTDTYIDALIRCGEDLYSMEISTALLRENYTPNAPALTQDAVLSQTVMQKPEAAPHFLKAAAKGAVFGFLFGCFGVLLYTFIKDTAPAEIQRRKEARKA